MTIEEVWRKSIEWERPERCALYFARGCKLNLQMDFDEADGRFRELLRTASASEEYQGAAIRHFPFAWERARKPLADLDPMEEGWRRARAADLAGYAFPDECGDATGARKRLWLVLRHLHREWFDYVDRILKPGFSCPCEKYERVSGGDLRCMEVYRFLARCCCGRRPLLEKIENGKAHGTGRRGTPAFFRMTAEGLKYPRRISPPVPTRPPTRPPARPG